jgi:hypothetical protein
MRAHRPTLRARRQPPVRDVTSLVSSPSVAYEKLAMAVGIRESGAAGDTPVRDVALVP